MLIQFEEKKVKLGSEADTRCVERLREMGSDVLTAISGKSQQLSLKITSG